MNRLTKIILILLSLVVLAFLVMFFLIYSTAAQDSDVNADALVVLGAAQYDGTPSPVFKARLDHAFALFANRRAPLIIVSGGKQEGDVYSEAVSGQNYLVSLGVPREIIITDVNSFSTKHNLARVRDIVNEKSLTNLIIVSDPFHMYRALLIARDLGLTAQGSPTRTSPISIKPLVEIEYVIREVILSYAHLIFDL